MMVISRKTNEFPKLKIIKKLIAVHKLLKKTGSENISVVIRDRPFERIVVLHKDSMGCVGFQFKNGKITAIVKDSSAARNGLLIDHSIIEIDGQNVVS